MPDKNIIQKQSLHFQYNGKTDAFALQKEVSDWYNFSLLPEIEQQLEPFALADDYITIDKLVIDVSVDKKDWQQKIKSELILSLGKKLVDYKPAIKMLAEKTESVSKKVDELILFYFEKGFLPWWGKVLMQNDFKTMLQNWVKDPMPESRAAEILSQLKQVISISVTNRIVNHLSKQNYFQFLQNICKADIGFVMETELFLKELISGAAVVNKRKEIERSVHVCMLTMLIKNGGKANKDLLLQFIYEDLKMDKAASVILKPAAEPVRQVKNSLKTLWQQLLIRENKIAENKSNNPEHTEAKLQYNKIVDKLKNNSARAENDLAAVVREGMYIENAGVVIIAAFMPALFEKLKITHNQQIENENLATMLIQYAVTGNTKMEEHELVLPKILCGIDVELPVTTSSRITAEQKHEIDEMLSAAIEYWAVIKNTSVSGLRESFLKRSGKLTLVDNTWLLQVEQKPFDMLLQQLPWSISMIKLPWMKNLLKTEWI